MHWKNCQQTSQLSSPSSCRNWKPKCVLAGIAAVVFMPGLFIKLAVVGLLAKLWMSRGFSGLQYSEFKSMFSKFKEETKSLLPSDIDVSVGEKETTISVDMPGVRPSELTITVLDEKYQVRVTGKRYNPDREVEKLISLPRLIDLQTLRANLADGVLKLSAVNITEGRTINVQ